MSETAPPVPACGQCGRRLTRRAYALCRNCDLYLCSYDCWRRHEYGGA